MDIVVVSETENLVLVDLDHPNLVLFLAKVNDLVGYFCIFGAPELFMREPMTGEEIAHFRVAIGNEGNFQEIQEREFDLGMEEIFKVKTKKGIAIIRSFRSNRPCTYEGLVMERVFRNYFFLQP